VILSSEEVLPIAEATGFRAEMIEKVLHLLSPAEYGERLIRECQAKLEAVLPFNDQERKFLDLLLEKGDVNATVLTPDEALQKRIQSQPLLRWEALNVKRHKELA